MYICEKQTWSNTQNMFEHPEHIVCCSDTTRNMFFASPITHVEQTCAASSALALAAEERQCTVRSEPTNLYFGLPIPLLSQHI